MANYYYGRDWTETNKDATVTQLSDDIIDGPEERKARLIVGIDFGTTFSGLACATIDEFDSPFGVHNNPIEYPWSSHDGGQYGWEFSPDSSSPSQDGSSWHEKMLDLDASRQESESAKGPYQCITCSEPFDSLGALEQHAKREAHRAFFCPTIGCSHTYIRRDTYLRHQLQHTATKRSSSTSFARRDHLVQHLHHSHSRKGLLMPEHARKQAQSSPNLDPCPRMYETHQRAIESCISRLVHQEKPGTSNRRLVEPEVKGTVNGAVVVSALADTGAGANFVSSTFAKKHKLDVDKSVTASFKTPTGRSIRTLGSTTTTFAFEGEQKLHHMVLHVLPTCVRDLVIGKPFLDATQTFAKFMKTRINRVYRQVKDCLPRSVRYMSESTSGTSGTLNGESVQYFCDTGSEVMLMSRSCAIARGLDIDESPEHSIPLEFGEGSIEYTSGFVKGTHWSYNGDTSQSYEADFFILDDMSCDVLLSFDFLDQTNYFQDHLVLDADDGLEGAHADFYFIFATIKRKLETPNWLSTAFRKPKPKLNIVDNDPQTIWQNERLRLLREKNALQRTESLLSPHERDVKWAAWKQDWEDLNRTDPMTSSTVSSTSLPNTAPSGSPGSSVSASGGGSSQRS